ncbi:MAG: adenylosuccinate lyase [Planctomycetota bacterium]
MSHQHYENPLISRYASSAMAHIWSDQHKHGMWRRLWIMLAEAERELGLDINGSQLAEMRTHVDQIDFEAAKRYERELRHDVMAHVHAYGDQCPAARPIIHLGATSCFVTDNTELMLFRESLQLIRRRLVAVIHALGQFAAEHRDTACLGLTHLQPAQPTTVGKRACLWAYDLVMDLEEVEHRLAMLRARSTRGTTGTQASFLALFKGDHGKVRELERRVAEKMGFRQTYAVTGQTYSRKVDAGLVDTLSGIAQSAHKAATDIRLLASRKELEEPFEHSQIGSSAMPYKRNPMRSERICSLARYVISLQSSPAQTAATQWMERTLDDSANRRLVLPQALLAIDAILILWHNVASGLVVYPRVVAKHLREELPFMASENILMAAVATGGDRQELHERIRRHSQAAVATVKQQGGENDLLRRLADDEAFRGVDFTRALDASQYVGRAPQQVDDFLREVVAPIESHYRDDLGADGEDVHV